MNMAWGDLCFATVRGGFSIVIFASFDQDGEFWDSFRWVWDPSIAMVTRNRCGFDREVRVGDVLGSRSFVSVQPQGQGRRSWARALVCGCWLWWADDFP